MSSSALPILAVGAVGTTVTTGLRIEDLGFFDSSANGQSPAAVQLNVVVGFLLDNVNCVNFQIGACMQFQGQIPGASTPGFTQFGTIINPYTVNTKYPIQTVGQTSSINVFGGELDCAALGGTVSGTVTTIGMNVGFTSQGNSTNRSVGGEWGAWGTHILNCAIGIGLADTAAFSDYAVIEITGGGTASDAVIIDGSIGATMVSNHTAGTLIAGSISNYTNGIKMTSNSHLATIIAAFAAGVTPVDSAGSDNLVALPSSAFMTNTTAFQVPNALGLALAGTISGSAPGIATILPPSAAFTNYNFNLPTGPGTSGQPLLSGGGGSTAMTFGTLSPASGGVAANSAVTASGLFLGSIGPPMGTTIALSVAASGNIGACSFVLPWSATVAHISFSINTLSVGNHVDVGVYNSSGTLQTHTGSQLTTTTGQFVVSVTSTALVPGVYFAAYTFDTTAAKLDGINLTTQVHGVLNLVAHTCGLDTTDVGGATLPGSISISNITDNTTASYPIAFMSP